MHPLRFAVGCVFLAIFAAVFGFAGAWTRPQLERYFAVAAAGDARTEGLPRTSRADLVAFSTEDPETKRLHRTILGYVAERNPSASMRAFRDYPAVVLDEAARTDVDHCLVLAQAQAESDFRPDAIGAAGEIGLYQMLPSTAVLFEPSLGKIRRPSFRRYERDLGDLADPLVSTRFAMAYLRDIRARKPSLRDALTEYNGGPRGRQPHYYRIVMATYVEILERPELGCRLRERQTKPRLIAFAPR